MKVLSDEILAYVQKKDWDFERVGNQYKIRTCPFCGINKQKFHINSGTGQYCCFSGGCDETGNFYTLKKKLGDIQGIRKIMPTDPTGPTVSQESVEKNMARYMKNLLADSDTIKFVREKYGITVPEIKEYQLGLQRKGAVNWLCIPHLVEGQIVNVKFRSLPPAEKVFKRIPNRPSVLYGVDDLDPDDKSKLYLIEGETDRISFKRLGYKNTLGITVGSKSFKPEWLDIIDQYEKVYVLYDPDIAGQTGAYITSKRVGFGKAFNVVLESGDLTDNVMEGKKADYFDSLLKKASQFNVQDILPMGDVLTDLENRLALNGSIEESGYRTQWDNINKLIGSFIPGDLVILSGCAKVGKSTFALDMMIAWVLSMIPCLYYCLEMSTARIAPKIVCNLREVEVDDLNSDDVRIARTLFSKKPLYLGYSTTLTTDYVFDTIRESVKRYGIEIVVFDHLHFLVRGESNITTEIGAATRGFKTLAEELGIVIVLVAQPRKTKGKVTVNDLKDSSSISQDGDTVIILNRDELKVEGQRELVGNLYSPTAEISVPATRFNPGGFTTLLYDGAKSKYFMKGSAKLKGKK